MTLDALAGHNVLLTIYIYTYICVHLYVSTFMHVILLISSIYKDSDIEKHAYVSIPKRSFNYRKRIEEVSFMNLFFILTLVHNFYRCGSAMIIS